MPTANDQVTYQPPLSFSLPNFSEEETPGKYSNQYLQNEISKVCSLVESGKLFEQEGGEYILSLTSEIERNIFLLRRKEKENPGFSALYCVRMGDLIGLRLLVANKKEVNEQDRFGRTALHLAAASPEKLEFLRTLLSHPDINTTIQSRKGHLAYDLIQNEEQRKLFFLHRP